MLKIIIDNGEETTVSHPVLRAIMSLFSLYHNIISLCCSFVEFDSENVLWEYILRGQKSEAQKNLPSALTADSKVERWRSHCFNYSSDFNCIFIVLYIYYSRYVCEWWSWTVRINPLKNDYYCRWFCPVGKMERRKRLKRERDGESKCRQRELIMIWITHTPVK